MAAALPREVSDRAFYLLMVCATLLAIALRLVYLDRVAPEIPGISDAGGYYRMGGYLAEGRGFVQWAQLLYHKEIVHTAAYAPLFPGLLALLRVVGVDSLEVQRAVVAALGCITVPLVGLLARALTGNRVAILAAMLVALSPNLIEIDGAFMTEGIYTVAMTATFLATVWARGGGAVSRWFFVGALLGLSGLVRSEALLFLVLCILPIAWLSSRDARIRNSAGVLLGVFLVVAPWTLRNALVLDAFVPIAQSYKGVLLGANCPDSYSDANRGGWSFVCIRALDTQGLSEAEAFDLRRDAGLRYAFDHVSAWPAVVTARVLRTWSLYRPESWWGYGSGEVRDTDFYRTTRAFGWLLLVSAPFALVPWVRRDPAQAWLLFAPILIVTFTSVIGYGNPRFRAAAEPCLSILAAGVLVDLWNRIKGKGAALRRNRAC